MKVQAFFLVWHIVRCACDESSPRASLMQTRSLDKQASSAVEASASRAQTLAGFQEYSNNVVAKYLKDGVSISDEVSTAIDTIITYIDAMLKELRDWHTYDKGLSEKCTSTSIAEECTDDFLDESVVNKIKSADNLVETAREVHKKCRTACSPDTCSNKACDDYHYYRRSGTTEDPDAALFSSNVACAAKENPSKLSDSYIQADAEAVDEGGDLMLPTMESCLVDANTWLDPLYDLYKACSSESEHCSTCMSVCNAKQTILESKHCLYDIEQDGHCSAYSGCIQGKIAQCGTDCPNIILRARARAADDETGRRIKCLLEVLRDADEGEKASELQACQEKQYMPYGQKNDYYIECEVSDGEPGQPIVLPEVCTPVDMPCGDTYLENEYRSLNLIDYSDPQKFNMWGQCTVCQHHSSMGTFG